MDFERKSDNGNEIECRLCVAGHHFLPYSFNKEDILFFFKPNNQNNNMYPFIFIKDDAVDGMLNAEHCIYGMIDMSKGASLLSKPDSDIRKKMSEFQKEIDKIGEKYKETMFITIGDSVLLKKCFKVVKNGNLDVSEFNFEKMIRCFLEIKESIDKILRMKCYGVFTYGYNKAGTLKSELTNIFHTGILSKSFSLLTDFDKHVRQASKDQKGDIYLTKSLYQAYRFYVREEYQKTGQVTECSKIDSGIDVLESHPKLKGSVSITLNDVPFLVKKLK